MLMVTSRSIARSSEPSERICDGHGIPLAIKLTGANCHDSTLKGLQDAPAPPPGPAQQPASIASISDAVMVGRQKYTDIRPPVLAIFAAPHNPGPPMSNDPAAKAAFQARDGAGMETAFEKGLPSARVVRLPDAHHYVFLSNESDVLREMNAFLQGLP
jgi:hypothetical protein